VIVWIGSLLLVSSLMTLVPEEVGVARERLVVAAKRLFHVSANVGAVVAVLFGVFALLDEPDVLMVGWMHLKILLVVALLVVHVRLYMRITALENNAASAGRREFSILNGLVSLLVLIILFLVFVKPF
jgi:putative membrane protein